jgi:polysaccharide biosynthesis/export protein
MRHGYRGRLIAGIGTAFGLCAAGIGCQSAAMIGIHAPDPVVSIGAPVALPATTDGPHASVVTARAAPPGNEIPWHTTTDTGPGSQGGMVTAGFMHSASPSEGGAAGPLIAAPEPVKGDPPEGKKGDVKKDDTELPTPHPLPVGGPPIAVAPFHASFPDVPHELAKQPLPPYVIEPPDILLVEVVPREGPLKSDQPIRGQHLVRPDGTIGLGIYGSVFVGGMTIDQAREAVAEQIRKRLSKFDIRDLGLDVLAYNSKFFYVVTDGGGYGEQVYPFPITGSETVLDALGRIQGLPPAADKRKVWVARRGPGEAGHVMPVDWIGIVQRGATSTNYQLMPGDRIYVKADHWISTDAWIGKRLTPLERLFGATLLGSQTYNSIRNRSGSGSSQ